MLAAWRVGRSTCQLPELHASNLPPQNSLSNQNSVKVLKVQDSCNYRSTFKGSSNLCSKFYWQIYQKILYAKDVCIQVGAFQRTETKDYKAINPRPPPKSAFPKS